jgi:hypothetical protein
MSVKSFVDAVKGKGPAATALTVRQALACRDIFFYGALLESPDVQALRGTAEEPFLRLLEVFCYGTVADVPSLPAEAQALLQGFILLKLQQLSLLSLCATKRCVTYDEVARATGLNAADARELEDLVIDTVTDGLLNGKIDPLQRQVEVTDVAAREVHPHDTAALNAMIAKLEQWKNKCEQQLRKIAEVQAADKDDALTRQGMRAAMAVEEQSRMEDVLGSLSRDHSALRDGGMPARQPASARQGMGSRGSR